MYRRLLLSSWHAYNWLIISLIQSQWMMFKDNVKEYEVVQMWAGCWWTCIVSCTHSAQTSTFKSLQVITKYGKTPKSFQPYILSTVNCYDTASTLVVLNFRHVPNLIFASRLHRSLLWEVRICFSNYVPRFYLLKGESLGVYSVNY